MPKLIDENHHLEFSQQRITRHFYTLLNTRAGQQSLQNNETKRPREDVTLQRLITQPPLPIA